MLWVSWRWEEVREAEREGKEGGKGRGREAISVLSNLNMQGVA